MNHPTVESMEKEFLAAREKDIQVLAESIRDNEEFVKEDTAFLCDVAEFIKNFRNENHVQAGKASALARLETVHRQHADKLRAIIKTNDKLKELNQGRIEACRQKRESLNLPPA